MTEPTFCSGLADIVARYDGLLVDQWGVLHDGGRPYPGAVACLRQLRAAGRRVVLLSNTGERSAPNRESLAALGFDDDLFEGVVTAGEAAWRALRERIGPGFSDLGTRCLLWSRHGDRSVAEGLGLVRVDRVADADFILLAGTDDGLTLTDFAPALERALARGVAMVCANPDVVVVRPQGIGMAPGAIARHYERLGGRVAYAGKPYAPIYRLCLDALRPLEPRRILAVGDSIAHDVKGGAAAGLDTALVMGGIHAPAFDLERGPGANGPALASLAAEHGATPRWVLPGFRWSEA